MADRADKHIERELGTPIASLGSLGKVAEIAAGAANSCQTRTAAKQGGHLVWVEPQFLHHVQHGERVDVTDPVVLRQTGLR